MLEERKTMEQLDDLKNRIEQFIELNLEAMSRNTPGIPRERLQGQTDGFVGVLSLIKQLKKTGKINRGNEYFPDPVQLELDKIRIQPALRIDKD